MSIAPKKLARLLHADQPGDVRRAAALVIGELGVRDADVANAVCASLADEDETVRVRAIQAAGRLGVAAALPQLLERVETGGAGAAEAAASAAQLGAKGSKGLKALMPKVAPGQRRYIAAALASEGAGDAAALDVLHDTDPGVVEAAVKSLIAQVPSYKPAQHKALTGELLAIIGNRKHPPAPIVEAAAVRLLAVLDDPRAGAALWDRIVPPAAIDVRVAAIQAVGNWAKSLGKDQLKRLFAAAGDADFRIAAPALMLLEKSPAADKALGDWLALLQSADVSVRRVALDKVGDRDTKDVAAALLGQLGHTDRGLRDAALARLTRLKSGRETLTAALLAETSAERAWSLARVQAPFVASYPPAWREPVFAAVCKHIEADDRRADPLLFLLREVDPTALRDRLEDRAIAFRKKKNYAAALQYLKLLARDPALGFATRFELACCGLKLSSRDLGHEARSNDPSLGQLAHLAQADEAELLKQLDKCKWIDPEEIYYAGFHFAEHDPRWRKFGGELLRLVIKRSPRAKIAQAAKSKLKSVGLD